MLFRKKIMRSCSYCQHGADIGDNMILCSKKGLRSCDSSCRKFKYDPFKRIPVKAKAIDFSAFEDNDYSL